MAIVLDASVALAIVFRDEQTEAIRKFARTLETDAAVTPPHWPLEVANSILVAQRRGRLTEAASAETRDAIANFHIEVATVSVEHVLGPILILARSQNLTMYDAAYLELAMREGLPLATLDDDLREAATRVGVPLVL